MDQEHRQQKPLYQPEQWRTEEYALSHGERTYPRPNARDQSRLLHLLGQINYKILTGQRVYVEVGGVVYKTLYGGYWRSVFTGIQHYLLRCEEIPTSIWCENVAGTAVVDLPVEYSEDGWVAMGQSLSFMLSLDCEPVVSRSI